MLKTQPFIRKISLVLIALGVIGCSDPKDTAEDNYIALECLYNSDLLSTPIQTYFEIIMNDNSKTVSMYSQSAFGLKGYGPMNMVEISRGVYSNDGDHHYLVTITESLDIEISDELRATTTGEFKGESEPHEQFRIDRINLILESLDEEFTMNCNVIDILDYHLADKENKNRI